MQDRPSPSELVQAVATLLKDTILPRSDGHTAFEIRVAINALELVGRQLESAGNADGAERQRLEALLGRTGTLIDLNHDLCARIAAAALDLGDAELVRHLWATTMEKLAVDQPSYAAYREELQKNEGAANGL